MKDYIRDENSGMLVFSNSEKEKEMLARRKLEDRIKRLSDDINILKKQVAELILLTRN
jgi:hypothetical protein